VANPFNKALFALDIGVIPAGIAGIQDTWTCYSLYHPWLLESLMRSKGSGYSPAFPDRDRLCRNDGNY